MTARTRLIALPVVLIIVSALVWTSTGTLHVAEAQKPVEISRAHTGGRAPTFTKPIYILMIGTDARERQGNPVNKLYDAIQLVAIDPVKRTASVIGIPRDTYVPIDGGSEGKINSAGQGGPDKMIRTVERNWGCRFDYYMLTGFLGFRQIVREIGGITATVERRLNDTASRSNMQPGRQVLGGNEALAFARNRKDRPDGDLGRSDAQGQLIVGALADARAKYRGDVRVPARSLAAMRRYIKFNMSLDEALRLGLMAMRIDPKNVFQTVADGRPGNAGGSSIVNLTAEGRDTLIKTCSGSRIGPA